VAFKSSTIFKIPAFFMREENKMAEVVAIVNGKDKQHLAAKHTL
jgi:hypothetical protein